MDDFKSFDVVKTTLAIKNGNKELTCANAGNCGVNYKWSHTPIWYYLSSPIMYSGMDVSLYLNPRVAPNHKLADKMAADITLEG